MDGSIQLVSDDDIMILPDTGKMKYRKDVHAHIQPACSVVAVGSMHYAGFVEAMGQEDSSIETSEREAV